MKNHTIVVSMAILATLLLSTFVFSTSLYSTVFGQSSDSTIIEPMEVTDFSLQSQVIGVGGGMAGGGSYQLQGTIGQPVVDAVKGGSYHLSSGFWRPPDIIPENNFKVYLPITLR